MAMAARVANIRQEYVDEPLSAGTAPGELLARYQGSLSERFSTYPARPPNHDH